MKKQTRKKGRSNKKAKKNQWKKILIGIASVLSAIVILGGAYIAACKVIGTDQVIWRNVTINGVHLENLTVSEATNKVQEKFAEMYQNKALKITLDGQEYTIPVFSMLGLDATREIEEAYQLGHGHWATRGIDWVRRELTKNKQEKITIEPTVTHPEALDGLIEATGIQSYNSTQESSYEIKDYTLIIHKGKTGQSADIEKLKENIYQALEKREYDAVVACPYTEHGYADLMIQDIANQIQKEVSEASLDPNNNYEIIPSQEGISLDVENAVNIYSQTAEGTDAVIELIVKKPEISTEDLKANLFTTTIGSYSTNGGGNANRRNNMALAAAAINGKILLPGETFSYNGTLGKRTKEKGYREAGAYSEGNVVQEVGGGICQVSSTLFAAVLRTNLDIVERRNHSMTVSYLPLGLDATVSWGGPDLKFKNNRKYPVKIRASYSGGKVRVEIFGANETDTTIKVTTEATGELSANTYRSTYDSAGNLISKEKVCSSRYKPKSTPTPTPPPAVPPQEGQPPVAPPQQPPAENPPVPQPPVVPQ